MGYLVVNKKSYTLLPTAPNKPYLNVKGSYLKLNECGATNEPGLRIKNNGKTYLPVTTTTYQATYYKDVQTSSRYDTYTSPERITVSLTNRIVFTSKLHNKTQTLRYHTHSFKMSASRNSIKDYDDNYFFIRPKYGISFIHNLYFTNTISYSDSASIWDDGFGKPPAGFFGYFPEMNQQMNTSSILDVYGTYDYCHWGNFYSMEDNVLPGAYNYGYLYNGTISSNKIQFSVSQTITLAPHFVSTSYGTVKQLTTSVGTSYIQ